MGVFVIEEPDSDGMNSVCVCVRMTGCLCAGYNPGTILRTTKDSGNRQILLIRFCGGGENPPSRGRPGKQDSSLDGRAPRGAFGRPESFSKIERPFTVKF